MCQISGVCLGGKILATRPYNARHGNNRPQSSSPLAASQFALDAGDHDLDLCLVGSAGQQRAPPARLVLFVNDGSKKCESPDETVINVNGA
jgi:hypothetical protein